MRPRVPIATAAVLAALAAAVPAAADTRMTAEAGTLRAFSEDAGVANAFDVGYDQRARIRFADAGDPYGIRYPTPPCDPGAINQQANVVEVFCDREAVRSMRVEAGAGEDRVDYRLPDIPGSLDGGLGADVLRSSAAADSLSGQQGNDRLDSGAGADEARGGDGDDELRTGAGDDRATGGPGADTIEAGEGDDSVHTADGTADTVDCGPGQDVVLADQLDRLTGCEDAEVQTVAPATGPQPDDQAAPALEVRAPRRQRGRRVRLTARAGEDAILQVSGYLDAGGINSRVRFRTAAASAGRRERVTVRLSKAQARRAARAARRGGHPTVRLTVSAVDAAGNTSRPRHLRIRLRA